MSWVLASGARSRYHRTQLTVNKNDPLTGIRVLIFVLLDQERTVGPGNVIVGYRERYRRRRGRECVPSFRAGEVQFDCTVDGETWICND